jgi:hypothetical protein
MEAFHSPFIVPVAAFIMVLGIIAINSLHRFNVRKLQSEERLAAIARGLALPPEPPSAMAWRPEDPRMAAANTRKAAIILIAVGLGIMAGLGLIAYLVGEREVMAGFIGGIIPLFIGIGMLVDYGMQKRELEKDGAGVASSTAARQV